MALVELGEKHRMVKCFIFDMNGPAEEAIMFTWWNSSQSHEPIKLETLYQARHIAGIDKGFGKLVEKCGWKLNATGTYNKLRGISWVRKAFDLDAEALEKTLFAVKKEWSSHKQWGYLLLGISRVYHYWSGRSIDEQVRKKLWRKSVSSISRPSAGLRSGPTKSLR
jgi:hypothetical protein